ncbi:transposase [Streptomyces sp. NBC_00280]|uniref:transposase n=1 Tax=Streptomyces sp. NBC_00280 TaxID=2975699 RepID=UPI003250F4DE
MSDLPRKNCWTLAEHAGDANPYGLQHLVSRAKWDADAVRDDICGFVVEHLHDEDAVLVVDETGDLKKGAATVGVQRQYTGTAGRIENSQVGWLSRLLHPSRARGDRPGAVCPAILDRVPGPLPGRRDPRQRRLRHGPALAARMIGRALEAGVLASWVAGDEVYGGNPHLRTELEKRQVGYGLAVAGNRGGQVTGRIPRGVRRRRLDQQQDEAGQGLRPPKGRTWAPRGARPVVRVQGRGNGRVNIADVVCFRPGDTL